MSGPAWTSSAKESEATNIAVAECKPISVDGGVDHSLIALETSKSLGGVPNEYNKAHTT
jgi:hypothetical protein